MRISMTEAKRRLVDWMRHAEAGEDIVLMRGRHAVAREVRRAVLEAARTSGSSRAVPGPSAARSQDFLYRID